MAYEYNQAPKEFAAQCAAFKKQWGSVDNLPTGRWKMQPKYDGVLGIINTTACAAYTRQNEQMHSVQHLVAEALRCFGAGWIVFMEVYRWDAKHHVINGQARKHSNQPELCGVVFDAIPLARYERGYDADPYWKRLDNLVLKLSYEGNKLLPVDEWVSDKPPTEVARELRAVEKFDLDGLILRDWDAPWSSGAAKNGEVIKVKPVLSLDLEVVSCHVEKRATKLGGYFTVAYNGVQSDVGAGLTQALLQGWLLGRYDIGKIIEVECLGITPDGKLREPRFKSCRFDAKQEELK